MKLRPAVQRFAEAMEQQLRKNNHKGNWERCTKEYLVRQLEQETTELQEALGFTCGECGHTAGRAEGREITREAADVANFAMMIADRFGDLMDE